MRFTKAKADKLARIITGHKMELEKRKIGVTSRIKYHVKSKGSLQFIFEEHNDYIGVQSSMFGHNYAWYRMDTLERDFRHEDEWKDHDDECYRAQIQNNFIEFLEYRIESDDLNIKELKSLLIEQARKNSNLIC